MIEVKQKKFADFVAEQNESKNLGMVVMGAGQPWEEWVKGISDILLDEKIIKQIPCFESAYVLSDNIIGSKGRTDLVLFFTESSKPDVGKLAIWRIRFGSVSWTDDFIVNHGTDYGMKPELEEEDGD